MWFLFCPANALQFWPLPRGGAGRSSNGVLRGGAICFSVGLCSTLWNSVKVDRVQLCGTHDKRLFIVIIVIIVIIIVIMSLSSSSSPHTHYQMTHCPLTYHPNRPTIPTKTTHNPPYMTISPLYDVLHHTNHIFSEITWYPLSTYLLHCDDDDSLWSWWYTVMMMIHCDNDDELW